ncbi:extracellular catalytic domain type 2 short-chain-length polyhydroxyalkanoate depolymerase [Salinimonas sediminis]|uniref:Polyhydroxybutyrate depolymerase n=1 Tax=Salinimonas sediminis TaxID=2303538 RepID=A0A346NKL3_9ALTE|nr:PHB depolymerase family esterase [Salinimonas sediminis]AXR06070.1 polyhydroxybutyrate depolymerase [Salinimonas sediminis]
MKNTLVAITCSLLTLPVFATTLTLSADNITVSGLSSGGYMANQFHLAYGDRVSGAAIISAGPFYCAQNDITVALGGCVDKMAETTDLGKLNAHAEKLANRGQLAPLSELANDKVWLFHGDRDQRVAEEVSALLYQQYQQWVNPQNVSYIKNKPFGHVFPTLDNGEGCAASNSPYIGQCNYDAAGAALQFMYGELTPAADALSGEIIRYDQHALAGPQAETLAQTGYAYVPKSCAEGQACNVHISFHGCNQYADAIGQAYVEQTGFNRWADTNNMVVFYPQTRKSLFMPLNPQGCWDWWGYTDEHYATRDGAQINAVMAIVDAYISQKESL